MLSFKIIEFSFKYVDCFLVYFAPYLMEITSFYVLVQPGYAGVTGCYLSA